MSRPSPGCHSGLRWSARENVAGNVAYAPLIGIIATAADKERRDLIAKRFQESRPYGELQQRMACRPAQWVDGTTSGGAATMALACALRDGGWPHLVLVMPQSDRIAIADGAPAMLPVMLTALQSTRATENRDQQLATLAQIWGRPVALAPAADIEKLNRALRAGRTANGMSKFAEAESAFREALDLQTGPLKANDEAVAATLLDLALNVSNQGRTEEAAALFRRATPLLQASASDVPRARLATYMGLEAANRGDYKAGLAYARQASDLWRKLAAERQSQVVTAAGSTGGVATAEQGELANALNLQARMELRSDNIIQAYAAASEALLILNKADSLPRWWKADLLLALGEVSVAQGRLSAAETYLNAALKLRRQLFGDGAPTIQVLAALGKAYQTREHEHLDDRRPIARSSSSRARCSRPPACSPPRRWCRSRTRSSAPPRRSRIPRNGRGFTPRRSTPSSWSSRRSSTRRSRRPRRGFRPTIPRSASSSATCRTVSANMISCT